MSNFGNFSEYQRSVISEIGNIGAGNAATALAEILADRVIMTVPELQVVDITSMTSILGGPETEAIGILVSMHEDVEGMLLFILNKQFVGLLIRVLFNREIEEFVDMSAMDLSAVQEIGNILAGAYVNAMAKTTNLCIRLAAPQITVDMIGAILSYPAAQFGAMGDTLMYIEENFISRSENIKSHLLIMPDYKSLKKILTSLGADE